MLRGTCHCGAIRLTLPSAPETVTSCNCSLCRRIGGLWAYYEFGTVQIEGHPEKTDEYIWGDKTLRTVRCRACGCAASMEPTPGPFSTDECTTTRLEAALGHYQKEQGMELGVFSISLTVKDIEASKSFYEKFGFKVFGGDAAQNWLFLKNGDHLIGLFKGMFEKNILTFNPGWDSNAKNLPTFTDVRELQRQLKAQGVKFETEADESTTGPASFTVEDPDGNPVLVDQHR